jgi:hypothetical protein
MPRFCQPAGGRFVRPSLKHLEGETSIYCFESLSDTQLDVAIIDLANSSPNSAGTLYNLLYACFIFDLTQTQALVKEFIDLFLQSDDSCSTHSCQPHQTHDTNFKTRPAEQVNMASQIQLSCSNASEAASDGITVFDAARRPLPTPADADSAVSSEAAAQTLQCKRICALSTEVLLLSETPKPNSEALGPKEPSMSFPDAVSPCTTERLKGATHKKCEYGNGCAKQPSFNYPGEIGGMFCGDHRLEGMVNVVNKTCEFAGCQKRPSLNYPGVRPALRCGNHKLPGMTNSFRKLEMSTLSGVLKEKVEELIQRPNKRGAIIKAQRQFAKEKIFAVTSEDHVHAALFQTSNTPLQTEKMTQQSTPPGVNHSLSPDFAAAQSASLIDWNGQIMKNLGFMNQLLFDLFNPFNAVSQSNFQDGSPSPYSHSIPCVPESMPNPHVSEERGELVELARIASIASSIPQVSTYSSPKRQKFEVGIGKIANLLSRTTQDTSGSAFANVAGRSVRPIVGRTAALTASKNSLPDS